MHWTGDHAGDAFPILIAESRPVPLKRVRREVSRLQTPKQYFGYRQKPVLFATIPSTPGWRSNRLKRHLLSYTGTFRQLLLDLDMRVLSRWLKYSGIQISDPTRFKNGLGNETEIPRPSSFYEVDRKIISPSKSPSLEFRAEPSMILGERFRAGGSLRSEIDHWLGADYQVFKHASSSRSNKTANLSVLWITRCTVRIPSAN